MRQETVTTGATPRVVLDELPGDLQVKGWDQLEVAVEARGGGPLELSAEGDVVRLHGVGDCRVRLPQGATLEVAAVRGDARIGGISGAVTLGEVSGDLRLRKVGATHVQSVFGDLSAKGIDGDLSVGTVYGDALASDVRGDVHLPSVGADLRIADVTGSVTAIAGADAVVNILGATPVGQGKVEVEVEIRMSGDNEEGGSGSATAGGTDNGGASFEGWTWIPEAGSGAASFAGQPPVPPVPPTPPVPPIAAVPPMTGDASVGDTAGDDAEAAETSDVGRPAANRAYDIRAGADIVLRIPADVGATVTATSGAQEVSVRLPDAQVAPVEPGERETRVVIGDGGVPVTLAAGGSVALTAAAVDVRMNEQVWRDMGEQFRSMGDNWKDMGEQFRSMASDFAGKLETQLNLMAGQLNERLSHVSEALPEVLVAAGLSDDDAERIAVQVRVAGERAAERTQRGAERAARAAESAARAAEAQARRTVVRVSQPGAEAGERTATKVKWTGRPEARAPEPASAPVSAEERLLILRMIEQGKLSAEEAERLLAAMTGRAAGA